MIDKTGIKGIYPVLNSLIRRGLIENAEPVTRMFVNSKGEEKVYDMQIWSLVK